MGNTEKHVIVNGMTAEQLYFVSEFAHKSKDADLVEKLVAEFKENKEDTEAIIRKYSVLIGMKPKWIEDIENLLVAIDMYRKQEEMIIKRLISNLKEQGIEIPESDIENRNYGNIKEKVEDQMKRKESYRG